MSSARLMLRLRHLVEAVAGVIGVLLICELVGRLAAGNGRRRAAVMFRGRQFRNRG